MSKAKSTDNATSYWLPYGPCLPAQAGYYVYKTKPLTPITYGLAWFTGIDVKMYGEIKAFCPICCTHKRSGCALLEKIKQSEE